LVVENDESSGKTGDIGLLDVLANPYKWVKLLAIVPF